MSKQEGGDVRKSEKNLLENIVPPIYRGDFEIYFQECS